MSTFVTQLVSYQTCLLKGLFLPEKIQFPIKSLMDLGNHKTM